MKTYTITITPDADSDTSEWDAGLEMKRQMEAQSALLVIYDIEQLLRTHDRKGFRPTDGELEETIGDRAMTVAEMDIISMVVTRIREEINTIIYESIPHFADLVV